MSPENQRLEDVSPIESWSLLRGLTVSFSGFSYLAFLGYKLLGIQPGRWQLSDLACHNLRLLLEKSRRVPTSFCLVILNLLEAMVVTPTSKLLL